MTHDIYIYPNKRGVVFLISDLKKWFFYFKVISCVLRWIRHHTEYHRNEYIIWMATASSVYFTNYFHSVEAVVFFQLKYFLLSSSDILNKGNTAVKLGSEQKEWRIYSHYSIDLAAYGRTIEFRYIYKEFSASVPFSDNICECCQQHWKNGNTIFRGITVENVPAFLWNTALILNTGFAWKLAYIPKYR